MTVDIDRDLTRTLSDYSDEDLDRIGDKSEDIANMSEPMLQAFYGYWNSIRGDRLAPSWKDFNLLDLPVNAIPYVVVADVQLDPLDFIIRFWGTAHLHRKGADKTGKSSIAKPVYRGKTPYDEYVWVMKRKRPYLVHGVVGLEDYSGTTDLDQLTLRLPLSNDGENVHHVVSMASWSKDGIKV